MCVKHRSVNSQKRQKAEKQTSVLVKNTHRVRLCVIADSFTRFITQVIKSQWWIMERQTWCQQINRDHRSPKACCALLCDLCVWLFWNILYGCTLLGTPICHKNPSVLLYLYWHSVCFFVHLCYDYCQLIGRRFDSLVQWSRSILCLSVCVLLRVLVTI